MGKLPTIMPKYMMEIFVTLALTLGFTGMANAEAPKENVASVQVSHSKDKAGALGLSFKINHPKGTKLNYEAPWKLQLKEHDGLNFSKSRFGTSDIDQTSGQFSVTSTGKPNAASGQISYEVVAFVCDDDKTWCRREVHKGTTDWKI